MRQAGVTATSFPRLVYYKVVGLDNTVAAAGVTAVLAVVAAAATTKKSYN